MLFDSAISCLGIYHNILEHIWNDEYIRSFTASLIIIEKDAKDSNPPVGDWLSKL